MEQLNVEMHFKKLPFFKGLKKLALTLRPHLIKIII